MRCCALAASRSTQLREMALIATSASPEEVAVTRSHRSAKAVASLRVQAVFNWVFIA